MRSTLTTLVAALATAALAAPAAATDDKIADPNLLSSLTTIERTATDIASGRDGTGAQLDGPVRTITTEWAKAAAILTKGGSYLVEMKQANEPIAALAADWKTTKDPRVQANEITGPLSDLFDLTQSKTPGDAHRLAYVDRKIQLAAKTQQWSTVQSAGSDLQQTWSTLKGEVAANPAVARQLDRAVNDEANAAKTHDAGSIAQAGGQTQSAVKKLDPAL